MRCCQFSRLFCLLKRNYSIDKYAEAKSDRLIRVDKTITTSRSATVYIKGFLQPGESPQKFNAWHSCHENLMKRYHWSPRVYGYYWQSGSILGLESRIGKLPLPVATIANFSFRALRYLWRGSRFIPSPAQLAFIAAQEIGVSLAGLIWQYKSATSHIEEHAHMLGKHLHMLKTTLGINHLRIVGHSLGCRLLLKALRNVNEHDRPEEIFLCAPALNEEEYKDILPIAATKKTTILYNPQDLVLSQIFPLMEGKTALGCARPMIHHGPKCNAFSVERQFNVMVHAEYKYRFDKLIESIADG